MARLKPLRRDFFVRSVHAVAPDLIGATLLFKGVGGVIVEVEAYHHTDPAAHSYRGRTERNAVMFGPPGFAYVYFTYGMHFCLNAVTWVGPLRRSANRSISATATRTEVTAGSSTRLPY